MLTRYHGVAGPEANSCAQFRRAIAASDWHWGIAVTCCVSAACLALASLLPSIAAERPRVAWPVLAAALAPLALSAYSWTVALRHKSRATRLADSFSSTDAVPALIDTMLEENRFVAEAARPAIDCLLPKLTEADAHLLLHRHHTWLITVLVDLLRNHDDRGLGLAAVSALRHVGTGRSVPVLQRVAERYPNSGISPAAREAIAAINERLRRHRVSGRLLRPASGDDVVLLRSARDPGIAPPQQLVRPRSEPLPGEQADG